MLNRLSIHVIGPRYGESIVLALPDGGVGVIDSFASGMHGNHPVVTFLKTRYPQLTELRFFAVTHPHADHCMRVAEILEAFAPKEVWIYRPFPLSLAQDYYKALADLNSGDEVEKAIGLPVGSVALSLLQFERKVRKPIKSGILPYRPFATGRIVELCGGAVKVHFLTPGEQHQYLYADQIKNALKAITKDGKAVGDLKRLTVPDHNLASAGVLVEYGKSRALLMSDAEESLWEEWLKSSPATNAWKPVQFLKAAHHGSGNGHHSRLYAEIADPAVTVAVVTPFNHGDVCLPSKEGILAIRPCVKSVYCTNRESAKASTSLKWGTISSRPLPSVPSDWVNNHIRRDPLLAKLLVEGLGVKAPVDGQVPPIPRQWVLDAKANPALWHLIGSEHRKPIPGLIPAEDHMISAILDDSGSFTLEAGYETGRLT